MMIVIMAMVTMILVMMVMTTVDDDSGTTKTTPTTPTTLSSTSFAVALPSTDQSSQCLSTPSAQCSLVLTITQTMAIIAMIRQFSLSTLNPKPLS